MVRAPVHRIFTALWPDATTRQSLGRVQSRIDFVPAARIVAMPRLHLTLHFLGALRPEQLEPLAALHVAVSPFTLTLSLLAYLPGGIVILEPQRAPAPLLDLHARLGTALRALGHPLQLRPFRPHVTLARDALGSALPCAFAPIRWPVSSWVVVESLRAPASHYRVLQQAD